MIDINRVMNIHKVINIDELSEHLKQKEWHILIGNTHMIEFLLWREFEDEYNMLEMMSDIEDLIPDATCYVSEYKDLCIVDLSQAPEDFTF